MPTTVTSVTGREFHLWQLPDMSAPEPEDRHELTTLRNELAEGHRTSRLFGKRAGLRGWVLEMPTLAEADVLPLTVTDPYNNEVSRAEYVRNTYHWNRSTGEPFVYRNPDDGQYTLVDFAGDPLTFAKTKGQNIFATQIELRERRIIGETVFDLMSVGQLGTYYNHLGHVDPVGGPEPTPALWEPQTPNTLGYSTMVATGTVTVNDNPQNGFDTVRLDGSTGYMSVSTGATPQITNIFMVLKVREATFTDDCGILSGLTTTPLLIGDAGTTKFTDLSLTGYQYRLNGIEYDADDQQAPMNEFGIVHLSFAGSITPPAALQIGRDRTTAGTYAPIDVAEVVFYQLWGSRNPAFESVIEALATQWGIDI